MSKQFSFSYGTNLLQETDQIFFVEERTYGSHIKEGVTVPGELYYQFIHRWMLLWS